MLFVPLLMCLVLLMYHVLVLTVRQHNMRHKIALWVKPQYTGHPPKRTFPPVPGLERFHCIFGPNDSHIFAILNQDLLR